MVRCISCRKEIEKDARYCKWCSKEQTQPTVKLKAPAPIRGKTLAQIINEVPELDGEYRRQKARHIAKTNKDRSRRMEQRVAKAIGGNRVPMSGAGSIKGDCIVSTPVGLVAVECKYTAAVAANEPTMTVMKTWFPKLESDVQAVGAAFGILVIHYHNISTDFVFIPERVAHRFLTLDIKTVVLEDKHMSFKLGFNKINALVKEEASIRVMVLGKPYIFTTLDRFIRGLEELRSGSQED